MEIRLLIFLFIFTAGFSFGQIVDSVYSTLNKDSLSILQDSLKILQESDSLIVDDTLKAQSDLDAVIFSSASDSISFDLIDKKMFVYGNGGLKYKETTLTGGKINIDFRTSEIAAEGIVDTSDTLTAGFIDTPVLTEEGEVYEGTKLKYNFKTQQGLISAAKNAKDDSYYKGDKVKKVTKEIFFIEDGQYSTCDADPPHTHFEAQEMKVIHGDQIIAKWIFMYIAGVPVPVPLPFAVFPNHTGRRSGFIIPTYGFSGREGSSFRNFGYFFALSDYYDVTFTSDYFTRGGWAARGRARYAKRYDFTGNLESSYSNKIIGEDGDPNQIKQKDWKLSWYHNHQINPTTRLDVNLQFQSGSYFQNNSFNYNDILTRDIISNATFNKRWEESGNNLTINYNRRQELSSGNIYEELPSLSFSNPVIYPFQKSVQSSDQEWYEKIGISYNGQFRNRRNKVDGNLDIKGGFQHSFSVNSNSKIGYFNVVPRVSYTEKWYNKSTVKDNFIVEKYSDGTSTVTFVDSVVDREVRAIKFIRNFDLSVSASTKLYGMFQPNAFGVEAFRHTIEPRISYTYQPDFSDPKWGYYDSYTNASGEEVSYDKYSQQIFGGVPSGERQSISFSVGNIFEMKTIKDPNDTTSQSNKVRLLNISANTGYNFAADSLRLSDLTVSYRTQITDLLNISANTSYTFYDYEGSRKINTFLSDAGKGLFRLTNLSISASTSISGEKLKSSERKITGDEKADEDPAFQELKGEETRSIYDVYEPDFSIPWNLSLNFNYNMNKTNPSVVTERSSIGFNIGFNLTKNWKITATGSYDLEEKELAAPTITVFRDLHCWEMNFRWNPLGTYSGFRFEIKMKAPELRDIKVTKSGGLYSGFGGY